MIKIIAFILIAFSSIYGMLIPNQPDLSFNSNLTIIGNLSNNHTQTIEDVILNTASDVVNNHTYVAGKFDCTDYSKELVKKLRAKNITAYCVGTALKDWSDENKTKYSHLSLHTWVEVKYNGTIYPVEATGGYLIPNDEYKRDYLRTETGVCW